MRGLLALLVAAIVIAAVLLTRGDESSSRSGAKDREDSATEGENGRSGAGATAGSPKTAAQPLRMRSDSEGESAGGTGSAGFGGEARDPTWSGETEDKLKEILQGLTESLGEDVKGAEVRRVECRSTQCAIAVAGPDSAAVVRLVEAMSDERGFYGVADGVQHARGDDEVIVYVQFRR